MLLARGLRPCDHSVEEVTVESHWGRLFRQGMLAVTFFAAVLLSGLMYSLFWVAPEGDAGKQWLVHWRPLLLRNAWTQTPTVSPHNVKEWQQQGWTVWFVDVRTDEERSVSIIPGAMTPEEYANRVLSDSPDYVVAYCTIGIRSGQWVDQHQAIEPAALNLEGGILGWTHSRGTLVEPGRQRGRQKQSMTRRVHVQAPYWNLVAEGYEGVW